MNHDQTRWSSQWTNGVSARSVLHTCTVAGRQIWKWSTVATGCHAGCCWIDWEPCLHVKERSASHYCSPCPCTVYHPTPQLAHDHPTQTVCNSGSSHLTTSIISAHELSHDGPACQMSCRNSKTKAVFPCFCKKKLGKRIGFMLSDQ